MTVTASQPESVSDREVLVSRLVDARASDQDWATLRALARVDETIWTEIIDTRRGCEALVREVAPIVDCAERVDVPHLRLTRAVPGGAGRSARSHLVGWAVAAVLALGFVAQQTGLIQTGMEHRPGAQGTLMNVPPATPQSAWDSYLSAGREAGLVVGELPERMVVDVRPSPTGEGYEAFYVRQVLERAWVSDLYKIGVNESGKKVLIPTSAPVEGGSSF